MDAHGREAHLCQTSLASTAERLLLGLRSSLCRSPGVRRPCHCRPRKWASQRPCPPRVASQRRACPPSPCGRTPTARCSTARPRFGARGPHLRHTLNSGYTHLLHARAQSSDARSPTRFPPPRSQRLRRHPSHRRRPRALRVRHRAGAHAPRCAGRPLPPRRARRQDAREGERGPREAAAPVAEWAVAGLHGRPRAGDGADARGERRPAPATPAAPAPLTPPAAPLSLPQRVPRRLPRTRLARIPPHDPLLHLTFLPHPQAAGLNAVEQREWQRAVPASELYDFKQPSRNMVMTGIPKPVIPRSKISVGFGMMAPRE